MQFDQPLIKLPVRFCAATLAAEVRALPAAAWVPHPQRFPGNEAVPLVTPAGRLTNEFVGPMGPTDYLLQSPYMMDVMRELGSTWGRSRLMGLGAGAEVPHHVDNNYYWRTHIRLHVPIITNPGVDFTCGDQTVNMTAGDAWVFDTFRQHHVHNRGTEQRVHLVFDTVGGERLWDLVNQARAANYAAQDAPLVTPGQSGDAPLVFERHNYPKVMSPWELRCHLGDLLALAIEAPELTAVRLRLDRLMMGWEAGWSRFETDDAGIPVYAELIDSARRDLDSIGGHAIIMRNGQELYQVLQKFVFKNLILATDTQIPALVPRQAGQIG